MLEEERIEEIRDGYSDSTLSAAEKALLAFADAFLAAGRPPDEALRRELQSHYSDAQIVELSAGLALFMGFSKIAIALGGIPENMPIIQTEMPGA